jgi:hypothetical protein
LATEIPAFSWASSVDAALLEGGGQCLLVDDAAAGGVDDPHRRLDLVQRVVADQADGLGGLREVDRDEVGDLQQFVQRQQLDAHLGGAGGLDVGVVGDDLHAEGRHPLRDQNADPAEADHAEGLLGQLHAGVLAALPLAVLQGEVGGGDVPGGGQDQAAGQLGGGDDVGGRRVHDHHAGLGRGGYVHVVETDAGAGDDLEPAGRGDGLRVDLGGGADEDRVHVRDGGEQRGAVGTVAVADLEVGAERVDGGRRQLFRDENDRLLLRGSSAHDSCPYCPGLPRPYGCEWAPGFTDGMVGTLACRVGDARRCEPDAQTESIEGWARDPCPYVGITRTGSSKPYKDAGVPT